MCLFNKYKLLVEFLETQHVIGVEITLDPTNRISVAFGSLQCKENLLNNTTLQFSVVHL